jgi:hypothetical protein
VKLVATSVAAMVRLFTPVVTRKTSAIVATPICTMPNQNRAGDMTAL